MATATSGPTAILMWTRLTAFYVTSPVCSPSRAGYLTGRYPSRYGFENPSLTIGETMSVKLPVSEKLLPEYLREAGYATAMFGKWHLGFANGSRPQDRGFDETLTVAGGLNDYFTHYNLGNLDMFLGDNPRPPGGEDEYTTDLFVDKAIDFVDRHRDRPFFLHIPFTAPHWASANQPPREILPPQAPQTFLDRYDGLPEGRRGALASVTAMDAAIGRLMEHLEDRGLDEHTLVIYISDNGGALGSAEGGSNGPLREGKGTLWEGGIRVPAFVRWPGEVPAGAVIDAPLTSMDLTRLMLLAAGIEGTPGAAGPWDGRDPLPALRGETSRIHDYLAFRFSGMAVIRDPRYKLVGDNQGGSLGGTLRLFDLADDIGERENLAASMPAKVEELQNIFNTEWKPAMQNDEAFE